MKFPEQFRVQRPPRYLSNPGDPFGAFMVPAHKSPRRRTICIIACDGEDTGWDHVSVSFGQASDACPTWEEMCFVKDLFFEDSETVIQYHPAKSNYVNHHPGCLHLWKPVNATLPMPPLICV